MNDQKVLLHVVCDYAPAGMEFGEITTRLDHDLANPSNVRIHTTSVPSLDTMAMGFAQHALAHTVWLFMLVLLPHKF